MADNAKYYYMRLKENFFDSENMVLLESMPDGYLYSNILLKLYLRSLKGNGRLMLNDRIPYSPQMIATLTRHQIGTVEKALDIFSELGLIEILDTGAIYMLDIQNYIGKSSTEADRQRAYQAKIASEKVPTLTTKKTCKESNKKSCKESNKKSCKESNKKSNLEIEKEIEIELEIESEIEQKTKKKSVQHKNAEQYTLMIEKIIAYLNEKAGTRYRTDTKATVRLVKGLISSDNPYTFEDFKTVIDKKCAEWIGTEYEKYLRPETLFGSKFEGYLNAKSKVEQTAAEQKRQEDNSRKSAEELEWERALGLHD